VTTLGASGEDGHRPAIKTVTWADELSAPALPVAFALTGAKADERETLLGLLDAESQLTTECPGQTLIGDKDYFGHEFEQLAELGVRLLRPARKGETERYRGSPVPGRPGALPGARPGACTGSGQRTRPRWMTLTRICWSLISYITR
jgi:hypothetical protein